MNKLQKKKTIAIIRLFLLLGITTTLLLQLLNLAKYPELYSTTLRYQLQCDIEQGRAEAITYYHNTYTANGLDLFNN